MIRPDRTKRDDDPRSQMGFYFRRVRPRIVLKDCAHLFESHRCPHFKNVHTKKPEKGGLTLSAVNKQFLASSRAIGDNLIQDYSATERNTLDRSSQA